MKLFLLLFYYFLSTVTLTLSFTPITNILHNNNKCSINNKYHSSTTACSTTHIHIRKAFFALHSQESSSSDSNNEIQFASNPYEIKHKKIELSPQEVDVVHQLYQLKDKTPEILQGQLLSILPNMSPSLVVALRNAAASKDIDENDNDATNNSEEMVFVGKALQEVTETKLSTARELLSTLLDTGEIRKLDSEIGKASKQGMLDMAFFTVMNMNIMDAYREQESTTTAPVEEGESEAQPSANRYQILQHIYTRCQEEVEKNVKPGAALLNKLLRTEVPSIRDNQIRHYLIEPQQSNTITTPDGTELQIESKNTKPLVPREEFIEALVQAVQQIRSLEEAGGITSRASAAGVIESCRQVAIQVRTVLVELYGEESEQVCTFEDGLQPVFRPSK